MRGDLLIIGGDLYEHVKSVRDNNVRLGDVNGVFILNDKTLKSWDAAAA